LLTSKACSRCRRTLPRAEFYPNRRMRSGLQSHCRTCTREWHRARPEYVRAKNAEFKRKNPTYALDRSRLVRYGLSPADVARILRSQAGTCAGCARSLSTLKACVDHDHATGRVRGLLCDDCNVSLGRLRDNVETLLRLAAYLKGRPVAARAEAEAHQ
jgi:hypothetical protein